MDDFQQNGMKFRWDLLQRFRLIEIILMWEGRLTTKCLVKAFRIERAQASKNIKRYKKEVDDENMVYDRSLKDYKPTEKFKPVVTRGVIDEYLSYLQNYKDMGGNFEGLSIHPPETQVLMPVQKKMDSAIIRPIISAARDNKRLEITYASLTNPESQKRIICPHTLVYNGFRWHVRAYCEKNHEYRDFVLTRFYDVPIECGMSEYSVDSDIDWNHVLKIKLIPDPRLTKQQQAIISKDFSMKQDFFEIESRAALLKYHFNLLNLSIDKNNKKPNVQQLIVKNVEELMPYL